MGNAKVDEQDTTYRSLRNSNPRYRRERAMS